MKIYVHHILVSVATEEADGESVLIEVTNRVADIGSLDAAFKRVLSQPVTVPEMPEDHQQTEVWLANYVTPLLEQ